MRGDVRAASVLKRGGLERAARLVEGPAQGGHRHASRRRGPHAGIRGDEGDPGLARDRDGVVRAGGDHRAQERAGGGRGGRDQGRDARLARDGSRARPRRPAGRPSEKTRTAASVSIPNGRRRPPSSSGSRRPESASARRSPARRRSVSFTTRSRMSSRPTTIEAWRARRRSNSPNAPRSDTTTSQPAGGAPRRPGTGTTSPRSGSVSGSNDVAPAPVEPSRPEISSVILTTSSALGEPLDGMARHLPQSGVEDQRRPADRSGDRAGDLLEAAAVDHEALELLVDLRASRQSVELLAHEALRPRTP